MIEFAKKVLRAEADAIMELCDRLHPEKFAEAVKEIHDCHGRLVVTGMGKAGIIGKKISATFSSTGTPSLFLHPGDALHGDLGMVRRDDILLALSNSGNTAEVVTLMQHIEKIPVKVIGITGDGRSYLGRKADVALVIGIVEEPCPLKAAPSASTTAILATGDALALTVLQERIERGEFSLQDFATYHPAGALGRSLLKVTDVMRKGDAAAIMTQETTVEEALLTITQVRAGAAIVVNNEGRLTGIFTDGDLRRYLRKAHDIQTDRLGDVVVKEPKYVTEDESVATAHAILKKYEIGDLPVVDNQMRPIGVLSLKDVTGLPMSI